MSENLLRNETLHTIAIDGHDESLPSDVSEATLPRAIERCDLPLGEVVSSNRPSIPVSFLHYEGVENLDDPVPGVDRIVSQITYMAAFLSGRSVDDLLVPHEFDPVRKCVKGLARPQPIRQPRQTLCHLELIQFENIDSACSFPVRIYDKNTPHYIEAGHPTLAKVEPLPTPLMSISYQEEPLDEALTEKHGIPIFKPYNPTVRCHDELFADDGDDITIVEPRMFMGGFNLYQDNVVRAGFLRQNVRAACGKFVLGGTGIVVPADFGYRI